MLIDRYSYDYAGRRIAGLDPRAPTLRCEPRGRVPLPDRVPEITWRAGLARDGSTPLALADGHGTWLQWLQ